MSLQLHLLLLQWLSHLGSWKKIVVVPFMITKQERNENTGLDFENNSWLTSSAVCTKTCKLWQGEKHERCCHLQLHLSGAWDQTVYVDSPSAPKKNTWRGVWGMGTLLSCWLCEESSTASDIKPLYWERRNGVIITASQENSCHWWEGASTRQTAKPLLLPALVRRL